MSNHCQSCIKLSETCAAASKDCGELFKQWWPSAASKETTPLTLSLSKPGLDSKGLAVCMCLISAGQATDLGLLNI